MLACAVWLVAVGCGGGRGEHHGALVGDAAPTVLLPPAAGSGEGAPDGMGAPDALGAPDAMGAMEVPDAGARDGGGDLVDAGSAQPPELQVPDLGLADGPGLLSETGLYADIAGGVLADGVLEYTPRYALWSDGADKRRFVRLPPGAVIDSSDPDYWVLPVGTRLWKEFAVAGVRIETRLVEKVGEDLWFMMAYLWNDAQTEAEAVAFGQKDARGTEHDVPGQNVCQACHEGLPDRLLGFSALQLAHQEDSDDPGLLTLDRLWAAGQLSHEPPEAQRAGLPDTLLGDALGYLHANCGPCHNPNTGLFEAADMDLWLRAAELADPTQSRAYLTTVGASARDTNSEHGLRITAGAPDDSELIRRIESRTLLVQMPPIGTERVDDDAVAQLRRWIAGLPPP